VVVFYAVSSIGSSRDPGDVVYGVADGCRGLLGAVVYGVAIALVPADEPVDPKGTVDYGGAYLGVGGLILFNFVWK
jgi:hypothetical protein